MTFDLFDPLPAEPAIEPLADGAAVLRGFARDAAPALLGAVATITHAAPWRNMITPGGLQMAVAMTNCGTAGWVSDRGGYRYARHDPLTGQPWPPMPALFLQLARDAAAQAGFPDFIPDACLVNRYRPGTRLSLHQDRDEHNLGHPIVSVSLGLPAVFLFGGQRRADRSARVRLAHGDVVVWGGPARLTFHGVAPLADGDHPLTGQERINLTLRRAL